MMSARVQHGSMGILTRRPGSVHGPADAGPGHAFSRVSTAAERRSSGGATVSHSTTQCGAVRQPVDGPRPVPQLGRCRGNMAHPLLLGTGGDLSSEGTV